MILIQELDVRLDKGFLIALIELFSNEKVKRTEVGLLVTLNPLFESHFEYYSIKNFQIDEFSKIISVFLTGVIIFLYSYYRPINITMI